MTAFDLELMALINEVHQLGSSAAIIGSATETRSLLSILRQLYRGNVNYSVPNLRPPLPMYHPFPFHLPDDIEIQSALVSLSMTIHHLGQVRAGDPTFAGVLSQVS